MSRVLGIGALEAIAGSAASRSSTKERHPMAILLLPEAHRA